MIKWPDGTRLIGDHFVCDAIAASKRESPLVLLDKDPRKERMKPDAFPVVVKEIGPRCRLIQPGDKVVIERWQWNQADIGQGFMVVREREVLIMNNSVPAPGVIVVDVIDDGKKPMGLTLPETVRPVKRKYVHGRIDRSGHYMFKKDWEIWFERSDDGQYVVGDKVIWRVDELSALMVKEPGTFFHVV